MKLWMQGKGIELTESNEQLANCLAIVQQKKKKKGKVTNNLVI